MRTPDGRTFRPQTQGDVNRADRKAADLLSRRLDRQPKILPPTAGITGVTRATPGGLSQTNAAAPVGSAAFFADYTIGQVEGSTDAPTVTAGSNGSLVVGEAGWYEFRATVRLVWDGGGSVSEAWFYADWTGADPYPQWRNLLTRADGHGSGDFVLRHAFGWGPAYLPAGGVMSLGFTWMAVDTAYLSAASVDVWKVG